MVSIGIALGFNTLDILTGLIGALRKKELKSYRLRDGLFKKVGFIFCYLLGWVLDHYSVYIGFKIGVDVLPAIILYTCTTELVSIIENIHEINPDLLPAKLLELFKLEEK